MTATAKKIVFAPGVLEQLESDFQGEELQQVLDEIAQLANDPTQGKAVNMTQLMQEDPALYAQLITQLESIEDNTVAPTIQ